MHEALGEDEEAVVVVAEVLQRVVELEPEVPSSSKAKSSSSDIYFMVWTSRFPFSYAFLFPGFHSGNIPSFQSYLDTLSCFIHVGFDPHL